MAVAGQSYPTSEVRGDWEETPCVQGQGREPGGATPRPRPVAARRRHPTSEIRGGQEKPQATLHLRTGAVTLRRDPEPEARDGS